MRRIPAAVMQAVIQLPTPASWTEEFLRGDEMPRTGVERSGYNFDYKISAALN